MRRSKRRNHRWTEQDFALLHSMTKDGATAKEVAAAIGCQSSTVALYRSKLGILLPHGTCGFCRASITEQPSVGRKRVYCDEACQEALRDAYVTNQRVDEAPKVCEHCGAPLPLAVDFPRRYCSRVCSTRAWWERASQNPDVRATRRENVRRHKQRARVS